MLSEEALLLILAFGALALLLLGVLELLSPTRPRHPPRRAVARDPWRRARPRPLRAPAPGAAEAPRAPASPETALPVVREGVPGEGPAVPETVPVPPIPSTSPAVAERLRTAAAGPTAEPAAGAAAGPEPAVPEPLPEPRPSASGAAGGEPALAPRRPPATSPGERCYELYEAGRFSDVVTEAMAALEEVRLGSLLLEPVETARLWGVVGLAKQALGDPDGARAAFEEAVSGAPAEDRPTWQRHLAALALHVGRDLLARAQGGGVADAEERVAMLHAAIMWLDGGLAAAPDDAALREAAGTARATLWPTYEAVVSELTQRQEFHVARRLLRQALADEECPGALQGAFRELLSTTYGGEVGQLSAEAIRNMQEGREEEALATLDRAEGLLSTIPEEGLAPKRRQELERRLWWGYTKVGLRRVEEEMWEEAVEPLLHALGFESVGPERQEETRRPLLAALDRVVNARSALIEQRLDAGDTRGALVLWEKLSGLLRQALEAGLGREELVHPLGRARALSERLGRPAP